MSKTYPVFSPYTTGLASPDGCIIITALALLPAAEFLSPLPFKPALLKRAGRSLRDDNKDKNPQISQIAQIFNFALRAFGVCEICALCVCGLFLEEKNHAAP